MRGVIAAALIGFAMAVTPSPAAAQAGYVGDCFYYTATMYECSGRTNLGTRYTADGWRSSAGDDITIRYETPSGDRKRTSVWLSPYEESTKKDGWEVRRCTKYDLYC